MWPSAPVPPAIERLIGELVHSVGQLEILLLLFRERERSFSPEEVVDRLRLGKDAAAGPLQAYVEGGLAACAAGAYRYQPASAALADAVEGLARIYSERPVSVIEAIYSAARAPSPRV